jgi:hypothetical protein
VTRQSYQQGYVSKPITTRSGTVFKIRYRVKWADGKWNHKTQTLYGTSGKKAARTNPRSIRAKPEGSDLILRAFVDAWWKPCLQRKGVKLSTKSNYDSVLQLHILPVFGYMRMEEIVPLHVEGSCRQSWQADCPQRPSAICSWSCRQSCRSQWITTSLRGHRFGRDTNQQSIGTRSPFGLPFSC